MQALDAEIGLFAPLSPFHSGFFKREGHRLYYEQCGNRFGIPVMFIHGGPGAGCSNMHRRLFNPERYHAILFDQRGCGRSQPYASLKHNTTQALIEDMEALRQYLNLDRMILFGGSWGSTLALAYAIAYPEHCAGLVLRGVFLGGISEINWFLYDMGRFFPEAHKRFISHIPVSEQQDLLNAYYRRLTSSDKAIAMRAANCWAAYENSCATLRASLRDAGTSAFTLALLEAHYFMAECFLPQNHIMHQLSRIKHLPAYIIKGRHDVICPPSSA